MKTNLVPTKMHIVRTCLLAQRMSVDNKLVKIMVEYKNAKINQMFSNNSNCVAMNCNIIQLSMPMN
jgi:hypothetical protein